MKQTQKLLETALNGLDSLGFRLEEMGITDKVNRHNLLAFLFAEQQRLKGELDSLNVRISSRKVQLLRLRTQAEQIAQTGINKVFSPVKSTLTLIQSRIN